ncbi:MAG: NYN domain-containing protein [Myxococcota bacterium]
MRRQTERRIALFFNGKTFYAGWREMGQGCRVDFAKMASWMVQQAGGNTLTGAHYYTSLAEGVEDGTDDARQRLQGFLEMLENQFGFFVHSSHRKVGLTACEHCGEENRYVSDKEVDLCLVSDMLQLAAADAYDTAIVVTGDADYVPALRSLRTMGKQVCVASWGGSGMSKRLRASAFSHIDLLEGVDAFEHETSIRQEESTLIELTEFTGDQRFDGFLSELVQAQKKFQGGFVGLGYFINKWRSAHLEPTPQARRETLDHLLVEHWVEAYDIGDGNMALRLSDRARDFLEAESAGRQQDSEQESIQQEPEQTREQESEQESTVEVEERQQVEAEA